MLRQAASSLRRAAGEGLVRSFGSCKDEREREEVKGKRRRRRLMEATDGGVALTELANGSF